jgi:hypothetical protein
MRLNSSTRAPISSFLRVFANIPHSLNGRTAIGYRRRARENSEHRTHLDHRSTEIGLCEDCASSPFHVVDFERAETTHCGAEVVGANAEIGGADAKPLTPGAEPDIAITEFDVGEAEPINADAQVVGYNPEPDSADAEPADCDPEAGKVDPEPG